MRIYTQPAAQARKIPESMQLKFASLVFFMLFPFVHSPRCHAQNTHSSSPDTLSFFLTEHKNLSIPFVLNGSDSVQLMFHTAASGISLIKSATENLPNLDWQSGESVKSWGGESETRVSTGNRLDYRQFSWEGITIWEDEYSGPGTDGKFGPDLFEGKCIMINFDQSQLVISRELPADTAEYEKIPLQTENGLLFMEGQCKVGDTVFSNRFLIHSGYGGSILFDDEFVAKTHLGTKIEIVNTKELKDSFGNVLKTQEGILPGFSIGSLEFEAVPAGFFEGAIGRQRMSVLGGALISKMNMIIDANREFVYVKARNG